MSSQRSFRKGVSLPRRKCTLPSPERVLLFLSGSMLAPERQSRRFVFAWSKPSVAGSSFPPSRVSTGSLDNQQRSIYAECRKGPQSLGTCPGTKALCQSGDVYPQGNEKGVEGCKHSRNPGRATNGVFIAERARIHAALSQRESGRHGTQGRTLPYQLVGA